MLLEKELKSIIRDVPNFPKEGIIFKDLTTVFLYPKLTKKVVNALAEFCEDQKPDAVAAIESRGFWFGTLLAQKLKVPFIPIRKKGKLPGAKISIAYDLEYGNAEIEIHEGHIQKGWNVIIHDDLLATGGTAMAAAELIQQEGAHVQSFNFLVDLTFLEARKTIQNKFPKVEIQSLVNY